jgi:hypothetical protein
MTSYKNMGTRFCGYHHTIAILIPLNWFCHRLKVITTATLGKMGLEWKLRRRFGRIIGAGLFFLPSDYQAMMCPVT